MVHFAYVDESGDSTGPSRTFALGCVLVPGEVWPDTFDKLIAYRRWLRQRFGVPVRAELRASNIIANTGDFERLALPEGMRHDIYRQTMRLHAKLGLSTFAVVVRKRELAAHHQELNARDVAWDYLFQRLQNATVLPPVAASTILLAHDEGEAVTPSEPGAAPGTGESIAAPGSSLKARPSAIRRVSCSLWVRASA